MTWVSLRVTHLLQPHRSRYAYSGFHSTRTFVQAGEDKSSEITIHDTMRKSKVEFPKPVKDSKHPYITWYTCGPTVYDEAHIGHARTYVAIDIAHRILDRCFGIPIFHVMGMTDVDDKIINRSREKKIPWLQLARYYETEFLQDLAKLNVNRPNAITRVTEHIDQVQAFVRNIVNHGLGYVSPDGSVYFDTHLYSSMFNYGILRGSTVGILSSGDDQRSALPTDAALAVESENSDDRNKKNPEDFALWKASKREDDPQWEWTHRAIDGAKIGRPGWHIECSAMIDHVIGKELDIHAGGIDLKFPHHENEIAQCIACYYGKHTQSSSKQPVLSVNKPSWPKIFCHTGHLHIEGRKMSKSLKNFITIKELLKSHSANTFRMFCLLHKYDANVDYSLDRMRDAENVIRNFSDFIQEVTFHFKNKEYKWDEKSKYWTDTERLLNQRLYHTKQQVKLAFGNDFDTPHAIAELLNLSQATKSLVQDLPTHNVALEIVQNILQYVVTTLHDLGLTCFSSDHRNNTTRNDEIHAQRISELVKFREKIRSKCIEALKSGKDGPHIDLSKQILSLCDEFRDVNLPSVGIQLQDRVEGSVWKIDDFIDDRKGQDCNKS